MKNKIILLAQKLINILNKKYIFKDHKHAELHWDCPECKARMLEGGLQWLIDLELFETNGMAQKIIKLKNNLTKNYLLTQPQKKVVDFIVSYENENKRSPKLKDIAKHLNKSISTTYFHIENLMLKGIVVKSNFGGFTLNYE